MLLTIWYLGTGIDREPFKTISNTLLYLSLYQGVQDIKQCKTSMNSTRARLDAWLQGVTRAVPLVIVPDQCANIVLE